MKFYRLNYTYADGKKHPLNVKKDTLNTLLLFEALRATESHRETEDGKVSAISPVLFTGHTAGLVRIDIQEDFIS